MSLHHTLLAAVGGLSLFALSAGTSPAAAQSETAQTIVVTAARLPQPLASVPLDLRVIGRAQIDRAGAASLGELLQRLAGVGVAASGGAGQPAALFLRGSNANHVVLLVDGVRVNSATSGTNAIEHLPLAQIDRIEVLHGPASGLYGADAIGGVVQVFTRRDGAPSVQMGLGDGGARLLSAGTGGGHGATRWSLQGGWKAADSVSATNTDSAFSYNPDRDPYRHASLGASLSQDWGTGQTLTLRGTLSDNRTHFDSGPGSDDLNDQRLSILSLESRNRIHEGWTSTLRLARGSDTIVTSGAFPSRFRTDQDQFSWQHDIALGAGQLAAGVEWRRESVDSDTAFTNTERQQRSLFGSYAIDLGDQQWQAALRHDHNDQFGGHVTGNLGWQLMLAPGLRLQAAAGSAFKAPSFNDLYYPLQFGYQGNPALRPERARSVEAGLRYDAAAWSLRATAFQNRIRDLILINGDFSTVENIAQARIRGLTLGGHWSSGAWTARAEATWQAPEDTLTGAVLTRRAKRLASAGLQWAAGDWRLGAEWVASGERPDGGGQLGGYGLLNLDAGWSVGPGWTLGARLDNVADKAYTQVRGYNSEGRRMLVTLTFKGR